MPFITQMRSKFAQDQAQVAEMIRDYNSWRTTGSFLHPTFVDWAGFPSDALEVCRLTATSIAARTALDRMSRPIIGSDTGVIFDTGVDQPALTPEKK